MKIPLTETAQDRVDVEVALAQRTKGTFAPEIQHHALSGDHAIDHRPANILQMQVIDPAGPIAHGLLGIATPEHQVTGIEAEPNVGPRDHLADLFRRFDVARAVMVKGRFVTAPATQRGGPPDAVGEL